MTFVRFLCLCSKKLVADGCAGDSDLVLELVEGGDLLDFILTNDGLSEPVSQHITRQMCNALAVSASPLFCSFVSAHPRSRSTSTPRASRIAISSPR